MFTSTRTSESQLEAAVRDLEVRTLANLRGELTKLVYLSSTRDYNTGEYQHDGLAHQFGAQAAQRALAQCHQAAFQDLLHSSLPALVAQTQQTMHEIERLVRGMQRHWLIRKYVEQADAAATNKASRVKKP